MDLQQIYAAEIECTLVISFLPSFIGCVVTDEVIHFQFACGQFRHMSVADRTALVFNKLKLHDPEILQKTSVIIETFTPLQAEALIESFL